MKKLLLSAMTISTIIVFGQTPTENYVKTTNYKKAVQTMVYNDFNQSLSSNDLLINTFGGASGPIAFSSGIFNINITGSLNATSNRIKVGNIKVLNTSQSIPNFNLGPFVSIPNPPVETGYFAKVENNKLVIYSPYFLNGVNTNSTTPIPTTIAYSTSFSGFYTPASAGGGCSGNIAISGGQVSLVFSGGWSELANLKLGNIVQLTSGLPDTDLGPIKSLGMDTAYRAKIESGYLVFYTNETIPPLPSTFKLQTSQNIGLTPFDKSESIIYFDGSGRPKQAIEVNKGGNQENIYVHSEYDNLGRKVKDFLPLPVNNGSSLNYYPNANPNLSPDFAFFYNSAKYEYTANPFIERRFDSGTGKVLETASVGNDWSMSNQKTIKNDYQSNSLTEVRKFDVVFLNNNREKPQLKYNGFYAPGELYKFITKDENWVSTDFLNKTTQEFKDKDGKLLLSRRFNRDNNGNNEVLNTYYVYDDYGNLSYVVPPLASDQIDIQSGAPASSSRTLPWTKLALVDDDLANEYDKFLSDYKNEQIKDQDLLDKFGGQGEFTLSNLGDGILQLDIDINTLNPMQLRNGAIFSLKAIGEFKDAEIGRIAGSEYEYIFYIKSNALWISGEGKVSGIDTTLSNQVKLVYNMTFPWVSLVDIEPKEAEHYLSLYKEVPKENILTTSVENNYSAVGGVTITVDENDVVSLNLSISAVSELKFKKGMVIPLEMERRLKDVEIFTIDGEGYKYAFSIRENALFIDGDGTFKNIAQVGLTVNPANPPVMNTTTVPQIVLQGLCYEYHYDNRKRMIEKRIPGKGWDYIVYDKLDRPVLCQDPNQRLEYRWSFTKYDVFNRITYTGDFRYVSPANSVDSALRIEMQSLVSSGTALHESKTNSVFNNGSISINYTDTVFPQNSNVNNQVNVFSVNYYDNYDFTPLGSSYSLPGSVYGQAILNTPKTLKTGTLIRVLNTNDWIISVMAYDNVKFRPVWIKSSNSFLDTDEEVEKQFDFSGNILETRTNHSKVGVSPSLILIDKYTYDHAGRLLKQVQKMNTHNEELIAFNKYDELGQLVQKKVGGSDVNDDYQNTSALQTIDLEYNIRGWLKKINDADNLLTDKLFAVKLNYNTPQLGADPLYNGNVAETTWRSRNDNNVRNYKFEYDDLSRLKQADYISNNYLNGQPENYTEGGLTYDKNGNIITLERFGLRDDGIQTGNTDLLIYDYQSLSNKLERVDDGALQSSGFSNVAGSVDYTYDINGNVKTDQNKRITDITYNHLNLPTKIVFSNRDPDTMPKPQGIKYTYDALGHKLSKSVINRKQDFSGTWMQITIDVTEYAGSIVYQNNQLQYISQPEGYIKYESGNFSYVYQYKDQLGNVRISYTDTDNDGNITNSEIINENNYYPFGGEHVGYNFIFNPIGNNVAQKRKFGSKEYQDELGLVMYDFGARNYDPALGRWMNLDPLADKYYSLSPYTYVANAPTVAIDPDGARILFVNGHWQPRPIGWILQSRSGGKDYWGTGFEDEAKSYFRDYAGNNQYIDGSSYIGGDSSGGGREQNGYEYAKKNYSTLVKGLGVNETFKIVTHSEGSAYGAGVAKYLMEMGQKVEYLVHLSPDEGDEFTSPLGTGETYELSYQGDWVTGNKPISDGVDVRAIVKPFKSKWDQFTSSHGSTKSAWVFGALRAMRTIERTIVNTPRDSLSAGLEGLEFYGGSYIQSGYLFTSFSINYSWP